MSIQKTHLLICTGSSCKKRKSKKLKKIIKKFTEKNELQDCLFYKESKCLKQCKNAPIVLISRPKEFLMEQDKKTLKKKLKKTFC